MKRVGVACPARFAEFILKTAMQRKRFLPLLSLPDLGRSGPGGDHAAASGVE